MNQYDEQDAEIDSQIRQLREVIVLIERDFRKIIQPYIDRIVFLEQIRYPSRVVSVGGKLEIRDKP